jgi:hypothetical protein
LTLRELFINWLTGSRFILSLEARIAEQRQDMTERLGEKDARIKELRAELAASKLECDRMRAVLMPFGSPAGAAYAQRYTEQPKPPVVPAFTGPDDWTAELNKMYQEESDGLHSDGRQKVDESRTDASTQPLP